jgi:hypothetical protein
VNFDPDILGRIHALKKKNRAFVPYFVTHHFFGKGNWIWCIPMRSPEGQPLISIGITYRKDIYPYGEVRTMEQFLECVGREHEVIVELARSGTVVDTNFYSSYMWECRQRYSPYGWYIIGDAGDTPIRSTVLGWPYRRTDPADRGRMRYCRLGKIGHY